MMTRKDWNEYLASQNEDKCLFIEMASGEIHEFPLDGSGLKWAEAIRVSHENGYENYPVGAYTNTGKVVMKY